MATMKNDGQTITPLADHPRYRGELDKLLNMQAQRAELQAKLEAMLQAARPKSIEDMAADLMAGRTLGDLQPRRIDDDCANIRRGLAALDLALREQEQLLGRLRSQLSVEVCREQAEGHRAAIRRVLACVVELVKAQDVETAIRDKIEAAGYGSSTLRQIGLPTVGELSDYESTVCHLLREAVEFGYLDRTDPLVKTGAVLHGGESFLPDVVAKREVEARAREQQRQKLDSEQQKRNRELRGSMRGWGVAMPSEADFEALEN